MQDIKTKYFKKSNTYNVNQLNPLFSNYSINREMRLPRNNRKMYKKVTFNPNVSVTEVESWKKYNCDMSKETEYMKIKKEFLALKAQERLKRFRAPNECGCFIF